MLLTLCLGAVAASFAELLSEHRFDRLAEALSAGELTPSVEDRAAFEHTRTELTQQLETLSKRVAALQAQQRVAPAFKWGQNRTDVFLQVKLSHRFEAPG